MSRLPVTSVCLVALWVVAMSGCGEPIPVVPEDEAVSYSAHLEPLVLAHCLGCHTFDEAKAKLVLEQGSGYSNLVGRRSVQVPTLLLVDPGDVESSYLWHKLQHRAAEGKGMPRTATSVKKLRAAELDLYRRWIEEGAQP